ncbi:MAG: M20 family metallopeptidase [Anaerolineae bacterium]
MTKYEELLTRIKEDELVRLCQDMVRIKTVNPPGNERENADYIADFLRKLGLEVEILAHTETRASVVARLKGSGEKPGLLYSGHLDVVPVGAQEWLHDPFSGEVIEGKLWGRGASDMKGGNAAIMIAAKVLVEAKVPLKGDLILNFNAGEEGEQLGANAAAAHLAGEKVQAVVITEPSSNDVYIAEKGAFWLELTTYGKTAHGSTPHLGQNAIMMMVALLSELDRLAVPYQEHPLLGGFTRSMNTITGGVKTNVVPDQCMVTVDQRTVPGQDHQAILRQVEELIFGLSQKNPDFKASVKVINDRIPVASDPNEAVVQHFFDVVGEVVGKRPEPKGVAYYTDAVSLVPALKAPLIICGPGEASLAHQPNEYVEVSRLVESAKILALAAARLLA